jgi:hypothetical protein
MRARVNLRVWALGPIASALAIATLGAPACTELKGASYIQPDAKPSVDAETISIPSEDSGAGEEAGIDAAVDAKTILTPPPDFACDPKTDAWSNPNKKTQGCKNRQVVRLVSWGPGPFEALSIARGQGGRVAVAINQVIADGTGELRYGSFVPTTPALANAAAKVLAGAARENTGAEAHLAATDQSAVFHLVYQTQSAGVGQGVYYRQVLAGDVLSTAEKVIPPEPAKDPQDGVRLALAVSPTTQEPQLAAYMPGNGPSAAARVITLEKSMGRFGTRERVGEVRTNTTYPRRRLDLQFGADGTPNIAILEDETTNSRVIAHAKQGDMWMQGTVTPAEGFYGHDVSLIVFGDRKFATFFGVEFAGEPTAQLVLSDWMQPNQTQLEVLDSSIPAAERANRFRWRFSSVLKVDSFGLLHVAFVRPVDNAKCIVGYQRQEATTMSQTRWLVDRIATDVPCLKDGDVSIAMTLEGSTRRAHVVYAVNGLGVYYASQFVP